VCIGICKKTQEYWDQKEWELTKLAVAFTMRGWYAAVTWHQGQLMLIVRSQKTMEILKKWRVRAAC